MTSLTARHREPELMDDPELDPALHRGALVGLKNVNRLSRTAATLWKPIAQLAASSQAPLKVLDVACGGGDVAVALARRARAAGLPVSVSGCDLSPVAIEHAEAAAARDQVDVDFLECDAVAGRLPTGYDVIYCSLFLHHLDDEQSVALLAAMKAAAQRMVLVNDLIRSRWGYWLAWCGLRILTRSRICHIDGPLSVRAAFTPEEARQLAARAGLEGVTLTRRWPARFLLSWCRT